MAYAYGYPRGSAFLFFCFEAKGAGFLYLPLPNLENIFPIAYKILCCFECENVKWKKAAELRGESGYAPHIKLRGTLLDRIS